MALYLTISEGQANGKHRPILALSDTRMIAAVLREIGRFGEEAEEEGAAVPTREAGQSVTAGQSPPVLRARGAGRTVGKASA